MGIAFKRGKTITLLKIGGSGETMELTVTTARKDAAYGTPLVIVRDQNGDSWYVTIDDTSPDQAFRAASPATGLPKEIRPIMLLDEFKLHKKEE